MNLDLQLIPGAPRCIGSQRVLLVAKYEEGDSRICVKMWDISTGEDITPKASRGIATATNSKMEMGKYSHGLCNQITKGEKRAMMLYGWW
jgi:hypothetical protein